jgi:hypothetical protein
MAASRVLNIAKDVPFLDRWQREDNGEIAQGKGNLFERMPPKIAMTFRARK